MDERQPPLTERLAILDTMPVGVFMLDAHLMVQLWNSRLENWTNLPRAAVLGQPVERHFPPLRALADLAPLRRLFVAGGEAFTLPDVHALRLLTSVDRRITEVTVSPVALAEGYGALFVVETIPVLNTADEGAAAARQIRKHFLANMSHEIRTPMTALMGYAELLGYEPSLSEQARRYLSIVMQSGERLLRIVDDVLELARAEAGRVVYVPEQFDLFDLLGTTKQIVEAHARKRDVTLLLDIAPAVPRFVESDETKMRQIVRQLLYTAIALIETGTVTLRAAAVEPSRLILTVASSPLPPPLPSLSLEPFAQPRTGAAARTSSGLGLAIARQYVQLMGGDIDFEVSAEAGIRLTVWLPVRVVDTLVAAPPVESRQVIGLVGDPPPEYRILCAEDAPDIRRLLRDLLEPVGFRLIEATTGSELLDLWHTWEPDVILLDTNLPDGDVEEMIGHIKATAEAAPPVIIVLTANLPDVEQSALRAAGGDDILLKPFKAAALFACLQQQLGVHYHYSVPAADGTSFEITPAQLASLPARWRHDLDQSARAADLKRAKAVIEQIATRDPALARALDHLVQNFQFDTLRILVHEAANDT